MTNFLLGLLAGCLIACVATIAVLRQPEIQARLGLIPPVAALACPPVTHELRCSADHRTAEAKPAEADALFSRRRFWYVAPQAGAGR